MKRKGGKGNDNSSYQSAVKYDTKTVKGQL